MAQRISRTDLTSETKAGIGAYVRLLRPSHWVKNFLVFAGLIFSQRLASPPDLTRVIILFWCFSALSSAVYIFNDWLDAPSDRLNPAKATRPLAARTVAVPVALSLAAVLASVALVGTWAMDAVTGLLLAAYAVINIAYTLGLKREPIIDVGCIASGFVLRAFAGATVIDVPISRWLVLCTIFLSLFLGFAKRRNELLSLSEDATDHRPVLREYSPLFLDHMIMVVAASTIVCYTLYTVDAETVARFGTDDLLLTVPFVLYGIFRYLYLMHQHGMGGSPTDVLLKDRGLGITIILWAAVAAFVIYRG